MPAGRNTGSAMALRNVRLVAAEAWKNSEKKSLQRATSRDRLSGAENVPGGTPLLQSQGILPVLRVEVLLRHLVVHLDLVVAVAFEERILIGSRASVLTPTVRPDENRHLEFLVDAHLDLAVRVASVAASCRSPGV